MEAPLPPAHDLPGTRTVLVVDDVRAVRRMTARLLSEDGFRVFEAASAGEALEVLALARGRVDVVLVDVVMPERSGVDLVRLVQERWPGQPVVFMSAHPAEVLVREGARDLTLPFLAKPFTRDELLAVVERAAAARRARSGAQRQTPAQRG